MNGVMLSGQRSVRGGIWTETGNRGQGAWRLCADTWLAEMNDAFGGTAVDGRRKEEIFQVGWRIWSQLRDGHSATRFGRATPQDSVVEDFWRLQEN